MGGADEGRAAYIMVSLLDGATGEVIPGHEPQRCLFTNITGLQLPIKWGEPSAPPGPQPPLPAPVTVPAGKSVKLRFLFRDATIFAVGAFE